MDWGEERERGWGGEQGDGEGGEGSVTVGPAGGRYHSVVCVCARIWFYFKMNFLL